MNDSREALRLRLRAARDNLSASEQISAAEAIVDPVLSEIARNVPERPARVVAGHLATQGELDVRPTLRALAQSGWTVVLPVCGPKVTMHFAPWIPEDKLAANRYGIPEPTTDPVPAADIDVVIVPGVGFDVDGSRIGHGAGYYDRFFAGCFSGGHDPFRIGVAHDLQIVKLPKPEPWDVGMHSVITPSGVISVDG